MKEYVLGFAFDRKEENIILVEKLRPDWQCGKYNGIGGKIETYDESQYHAMIREFKEETGVETELSDWTCFSELYFENDVLGGSAKVYCFKLSSNLINQCRSPYEDDEQIIKVSLKDIKGLPLIDHLDFLIPCALNSRFNFATINMK